MKHDETQTQKAGTRNRCRISQVTQANKDNQSTQDKTRVPEEMKIHSWQAFVLEIMLKVALARIFYGIAYVDGRPYFSLIMAILFGMALGSLIIQFILGRPFDRVQGILAVTCGGAAGSCIGVHLFNLLFPM